MSKVILLEQLKEFSESVTRDIILPVAQQKEDKEPPKPRAAEVFCTRKLSPFIYVAKCVQSCRHR